MHTLYIRDWDGRRDREGEEEVGRWMDVMEREHLSMYEGGKLG